MHASALPVHRIHRRHRHTHLLHSVMSRIGCERTVVTRGSRRSSVQITVAVGSRRLTLQIHNIMRGASTQCHHIQCHSLRRHLLHSAMSKIGYERIAVTRGSLPGSVKIRVAVGSRRVIPQIHNTMRGASTLGHHLRRHRILLLHSVTSKMCCERTVVIQGSLQNSVEIMAAVGNRQVILQIHIIIHGASTRVVRELRCLFDITVHYLHTDLSTLKTALHNC